MEQETRQPPLQQTPPQKFYLKIPKMLKRKKMWFYIGAALVVVIVLVVILFRPKKEEVEFTIKEEMEILENLSKSGRESAPLLPKEERINILEALSRPRDVVTNTTGLPDTQFPVIQLSEERQLEILESL